MQTAHALAGIETVDRGLPSPIIPVPLWYKDAVMQTAQMREGMEIIDRPSWSQHGNQSTGVESPNAVESSTSIDDEDSDASTVVAAAGTTRLSL